MKMQSTLLVVILSFMACASAMPRATCPVTTVQAVLDLDAYVGRWFEIERIREDNEPFGACVTANYTLADTTVAGTTYPVTIVNRMLNDMTSNYASIAGGARKADDSGDGKLKIRFAVAPTEGDYWVLETDYENYSLVYVCREDGLGNISEMGWFLARVNNPSRAIRDMVDAAIIRNGLTRENFIETRQDNNCIYE